MSLHEGRTVTDRVFDEAAYREAFPDVVAAIARGAIRSGREHFEASGREEGRLAHPEYIRIQAARSPAVNIDMLVLSSAGTIFLVGWCDDRHDRLEEIEIRLGGALPRAFPVVPRLRRRDAEAALDGDARHPYGFWLFDTAASAEALPPGPPPHLELACQFASGGRRVVVRQAVMRQEQDLRGTALEWLGQAEWTGHRLADAFANLDAGSGEALLACHRALVRQAAVGAVAERFGTRAQRPTLSVIVPLHGSVAPIFLQAAAFAQRGEAVEFIHVLDNPALIDAACREARIAATVYGACGTLVLVPDRVGPGAARRIGTEFAGSDRLLFLTPDTLPVAPDWAERHADLLANLPAQQTRLFGGVLLGADGALAAAGAYLEADQVLSPSGSGLTRRALLRVEPHGRGAPPGMQRFTASRPVAAVGAACLSVARDWFERLGGFADDYLGDAHADADLCLRSLQSGTSAWVHDLPMWHLASPTPAPAGETLYDAWQFGRVWEPVAIPSLIGRAPDHPLWQAPRPQRKAGSRARTEAG